MSKSLRDEIRAILAVGIAAVVMSPAALAQEQQKPEEQKDEQAASEVEFQEVVVTGSRIRRTEFDSPGPVTIITSERSQLAGLVSTEEVLRNTTASYGDQVNDAFAGFVTDGGPGANLISLRGLGAQRTLVLVNGKRWSPSGVQGATYGVDLTAIPQSIIGRIEILKDGASSVYGADAVAGVVNVITKESFDGFQLNGVGQATHDGGGERYALDASWGKVGDRGSISVSASYQEQEELVAADRDWSRCPTLQRWTDQFGDGVIDNRDPFTGKPLCFGHQYYNSTAWEVWRYEPTYTDVFDTTSPFYDPRIALLSSLTGVPLNNYTRVPPNGFAPGQDPLGTGTTRPRSLYDNEGRWLRDERSPDIEHIAAESKLYSATSFGQLDFDVGAGTSTAYYEAYWNRRETRSNFGYSQFFPFINAYTYQSGFADPNDGFDQGPDLNPVNPFSSFELFSPGTGFSQPVVPQYQVKDPNYYVDLDRYNVFAGLKGDLAGSWDYDFVVGYGHSKGTYEREQLLADRVEAAVNGVVVRGDGSVTCADEFLAQWSNCVPLNLFTEDAQLRGIWPQEAIDFLVKNTRGTTVYEGWSASAYATGDLFSMPAGAVKAVFGAEYREESIDDTPDIEAQNDNYWGFSAAGITRGEDKVKELFTEIEVPLMTGKRLAEDMTLSGSLRWTDYDSYGSDTTYRVAFNYQITPQFAFRSTYGTSFRAPDLYEQFLGDQTGFVSNVNDPCYQYGLGNLQPGDTLYDNCASLGLPPNFFPSSSILAITGGASDLKAETSDSLTIGLVFKPDALDMSFALTYFDIQLEDTVASPSVGYIASRCYLSAGFTDQFCDRVGPRTPYIPGATPDSPGSGGELEFVDSSFINIGTQQSRGYDFNFLYEHQFEVGSLTIDGILTYIDKQNYELFGTTTRQEGRWGFPRLTANTQIRYDWRDWQFGWFMDFIGESQEAPVFDPGTTNQDRQNRTPNILYHTLSTRYRAADWEATLSVRNVFDKAPPYVGDGHTTTVARDYNTLPGVGYDLFGRSYVLSLAYRF
jgi:iron complex outermembrane receptor protein